MPEFGMLVSIGEMKGHLGLTDHQSDDDGLIQQKIFAAQRLIERELGFRFHVQFETPANVPEDIREAIMQLAAWWFENREAVTERGALLPFGVAEIIAANRDWTF